MIEFTQQYMLDNVHLNLEQRAAFMCQKGEKWNTYSLRQAYRQLGIKHKLVRLNRLQRAPNKEHLVEGDKQTLLNMHQVLGGCDPDSVVMGLIYLSITAAVIVCWQYFPRRSLQ